MSVQRQPDPVTPPLTFDSYAHPFGTRQTARHGVTPMTLAVCGICVLTFLLGVMTTLYLTGPRVAAPAQLIAEAPGGAAPAMPHEQEVTRTEAPDMLSVTPVTLPEEGIDALEQAVLKGLVPERTVGRLTPEERAQRAREALQIISRNKLRMLREGVLANVYTVETREEDGRRRIVLKTINADMTSQSMANLLRDAQRDGLIEVPVSLTQADGGVDMETMIFDLVQQSLSNDGTSEGAAAAREMSRRAFAASNARTREVDGERVYVVEPGDSLAYISLQFYGRPDDYNRIFEANRSQISSPDLIRIGQRLIIPG